MTVALKPVLINPLVVTLKASGNPDIINANGRDVELRWPSVPVTDTTIDIRGAHHIVSIGGHFKPTGADDDANGALEIRNQVTGGVAYLERMLIDLSARSNQQAYVHSDPHAIDKIPVTGDAIGFGGVVSSTAPTYPSFVMVQSIIQGVSGQHPSGCSTCSGSHADAFQLRGPIDNVTFKDVHVSSTYQGFFVAPANNYYGEIVPPEKQQKAGGVITFDNVTATVVKPGGLTTAEADEWRDRAAGFYMESYSLRQEGKQSYFDIDVGPGGIWLETPESASTWLSFIAGETVLHDAIDANTATIEYANSGAILRRGQSPNIPDKSMVGPGSTLEGTDLNEVLGGPGNDYLWGSVGDDDIDGGAGIDTALFAGLFRGYEISPASFDSTGANVQVIGPEGHDFIYGIESLQFADGRKVYDLNDPMAAVYRMYDSAFGRAPDALGKNGWTAFLQQGHSITEIASGFAGSAEFSATYGSLTNQQFVEQLYHNVLGRAGDAAGVSGWTASLNSGASRGQVLAGFSESAEHIQLLSPEIKSGIWDINETAASVARLYHAALDRLPDANGLVGWKNAIDSGMSLSTAADGFAASAEFQFKYGTLTNQQFVEHLYHNVLDRDGEAAGVSGWTNYLNSGAGDRGDVLLGFSESFEHQVATLNNIDNGILYV